MLGLQTNLSVDIIFGSGQRTSFENMKFDRQFEKKTYLDFDQYFRTELSKQLKTWPACDQSDSAKNQKYQGLEYQGTRATRKKQEKKEKGSFTSSHILQR